MPTLRKFLAAACLAATPYALADEPTPSPTPTTAPTQMPAVVPAPVLNLSGTVDCSECEPTEEPETRYLLENILGQTPAGANLLENGWRVYGWTQGSYTTSSVSRSTLPVPFIDRANEFSLNQNWLHVEKTVDTSKSEFQLGGAVDLILPGTDARFSISRGLLDEQTRRGDIYPIDLFQAYVDVFAPNVGPQGTTFRFGKFATLIGYETVQAISTPFASRSYNFQYNPFTHTGAVAFTPLNDNWSVANGLVMGNDTFFDPASRLTYINQLKWAPKEGKSSVALNTSITNPRYDAAEAFAFYNTYNLLFTHQVADGVQYAMDATFSHMDAFPGVGSANWYGFANYLLYDVTDCLQSKVRFEMFEDSKGVRTGNAGLYTAVTYGLTWQPLNWLAVMPEVRYDHASKGRPFEGDRDMFTATIGSIIRW